ncbi:hypothetical protein A8C40_07890 [Ligilactobacillus salivarius]|uniref:hypothetical protein n=1 Tax=Ligilactobacillus salivarius TaxID=1624 RepID=UPI000BB07DCE|nr:hypothetical protein [Ligilactobacillus salivarius]PAY50874.1 hypothetical protein A8C41_10405 [Ligilactobacillus salivarius]PAY58312.1 hypothetical protein A8C40_07890 [Ligilactobacillus salivarius]
MNEYQYFTEILDGLHNIIKIDDNKKEIQELEKKLNAKKKSLEYLQKKGDEYNDIANNLKNIAIDINKVPKAMQDEFKSLIAELIKRDYISIVDVYNLK